MFQRLVLTALFAAMAPGFARAAVTAGPGAQSASKEMAKEAAAKDPAKETSKASLAQAKVRRTKASNYSLGLTVGQEGYISRSSEQTGTNDYTEVGARFKAQTTPNSKSEYRGFGAKIDIGATTATSVENYTNFEAPEAFVSYTTLDLASPGANPGQFFSAVDLGRKKMRWSGVDSDWSLGLVQPLNRFDGLRPSEQGLAGAFATFGGAGVNFTAFASPLFIPEQGAPQQVENGRFTTSSPWFSAPPDSLILSLGSSPVRSPVNYSLNIPEIGSIVSQASFGGILRVSDPNSSEGFFAQASYLRKPQNALSLSFSGKLTLGDSTTYGDVDIFPEVVYHSVAGVDIGYAEALYSLGVSALYERPDQPTANAEITSQQLEPMTMVSPTLELRPFEDTMFAPKLKFSYLSTQGGEVTTIGKFAANGNVFGPRTMFRKAVSASMNSTLYRSQRLHLSAGARWIE
ncbi:MAG: hypothetical protein EOP05_05670, partial [Proteobacteria bacterium]